MQSFLQHRQIGQEVRRKTSRDTEKAKASGAGSQAPVRAQSQTARVDDEEVQESAETLVEAELSGELVNMNSISNVATRYSESTALGHALDGIHIRERTTREGKGEQVFIVGWNGDDDPANPHNYSLRARIGVTLMVTAVAFVVTAASSIDSAILPQASEEFGVSDVVESLATGSFLIGFGSGTLVAGPLSEAFGRNPVYLGSLFLFMIFTMGSGLSPNIGAQIAFRFLAGFCGCPPLTCAGGTISDLWSPMEKTFAFPLYAIPGFGGPMLGPVIGSYIGASGVLSWRWTEWITLIMSGLVLAWVILLLPETHPHTLLKWKAQHLRQETGDNRYRAEVEIIGVSFRQKIGHAMSRPFILILSEAVIGVLTLYLTTLYIVLFTFLNGYTYIFGHTYGTSQGLTNVLFVAMFVGCLLCTPLVPLVYTWTKKDLELEKAKGHTSIRPETRLWFAMLGGAPCIPISLFWMAWTDYPSISIWSPLVASVLFGYGVVCIFMSVYMYIIDSYEVNAASALTFVAFIRYLAAGGMTVVGIPFYENVGTHWTLTILGALSVLLMPVPYLLYMYGPTIRKHSKYAIERD